MVRYSIYLWSDSHSGTALDVLIRIRSCWPELLYGIHLTVTQGAGVFLVTVIILCFHDLLTLTLLTFLCNRIEDSTSWAVVTSHRLTVEGNTWWAATKVTLTLHALWGTALDVPVTVLVWEQLILAVWAATWIPCWGAVKCWNQWNTTFNTIHFFQVFLEICTN